MRARRAAAGGLPPARARHPGRPVVGDAELPSGPPPPVDSLVQICIPLRRELQSLREELESVERGERQSLAAYNDSEDSLLVRLDQLRPRANGTVPANSLEIDQLFKRIVPLARSNRQLRNKIIATHHHVSFQISQAQKGASDARFRFDGDRLLAGRLDEELRAAQAQLAELEAILDAVRQEFIGLTLSRQTRTNRVAELTADLERADAGLADLAPTRATIERKWRNMQEKRKKREAQMRAELDAAKQIRDAVKADVDAAKRAKSECQGRIERLDVNEEDLLAKLHRINAEIEHLAQQAHHRNRQIELLRQIVPEPS